MSKEVAVILKAYDQTAAAFKSAEKQIDRFVKGAEKTTKALVGIFAVDRLGAFLKKSAQMAAEADEESSRTMKHLTDAFDDAQIAIGKAILGNRGIVFGLETLADALSLFAVAIERPVDAIKAIFTNLWNSTGWVIGKLLEGIGALTGSKDLQNIGGAMADNATLRMAGSGNAVENLISGTRGRSRGLEKNRGPVGSERESALNVQPRVWRDWSDKYNKHDYGLVTEEEFEENLRQTLNVLGDRLPKLLEDMQIFEDLKLQFKEQVAGVFGDAISQGIEAALMSGNVGLAFKALSGALVGGFGVALEQFGQASLAAAILQEGILNSLMNLIPGGAIGRSIAMIALGKTLQIAAKKAFGPKDNYSSASASTASSLSSNAAAYNDRGTLTIYLPDDAIVRASDPAIQDLIAQAIRYGAGRNLVFRPA